MFCDKYAWFWVGSAETRSQCMKEEKCENCKFFSYVEEEGLSSDGVKRGDCRRHPPNQHGVFSETQHDYFCGEFKGRE